mgnify:CR=1 FL=1
MRYFKMIYDKSLHICNIIINIILIILLLLYFIVGYGSIFYFIFWDNISFCTTKDILYIFKELIKMVYYFIIGV